LHCIQTKSQTKLFFFLAYRRLHLVQEGFLHKRRHQSADHLAGWALQQQLPVLSSKTRFASQRSHGVWLCNNPLACKAQVRHSENNPTPSLWCPLVWTSGVKDVCFHCRPEFLEDFTVAGTIQDYVVSMLCGLDGCVMTPQNAASWGFFNTSSNLWNVDMCVKGRAPRSV